MGRIGVRELWRRDTPAFGAWSMLSSADAMEVVARTGFDFICVDNQHGLAGYESTLSLIRTIDLGASFPFVRVPWNEPGYIGRVLDAGAMGIIVPMVNTAEQAAAAVRACRYPPEGIRSFGPLRVGMRDGADYFGNANRDVVVAVMIETAAAIENVGPIASTPGVDVLFLGPYDLSVNLGLPPGDNDGVAAFDAAIAAVQDACRRSGRVAGILSNPALAPLRVEQGFRMISVSMDSAALSLGLENDLSAARSTTPCADDDKTAWERSSDAD